MRYEGAIYRPPSEADSLILQVTIGCSHNKCTFCGSFKDKKFRVRKFEEIKEDIEEAKAYAKYIRKVFLADGDALILSQKRLLPILKAIKDAFPKLERIGIYGNTKSILNKSVEELKVLKDLGVGIIYLGVESGDQVVLDMVNKGTKLDDTAEAAKRVKDAGIILSVTVLLGLGGVERSAVHAEETGKFLSRIDPDYAGALSVILVPGTPLAEAVKKGTFQVPTPYQLLEELAVMIRNTNVTHTFFASNHASNYLPVKAWLPEEKEKTLKAIQYVLDRKDPALLRPEYMRAL
ncbi:MAG: Oxygen-independent coproporphyrinogen-III oxidase 1 [Syntrophorhabdus sp. PtaU1.Bin050]|nr:MAG: Oxygen-independent coproporphyrinogen-III oxidase 1 [Syntrophorhabdus sp. PtaU1.Bin050]